MTDLDREEIQPTLTEEAYPIRTVSTLTGVNPITLRAWERRYGLIRPVRTAKGHRLYTRDQIVLINRVVSLLEKGISISQVRSALKLPAQPEGDFDDEDNAITPVWGQYQARMVAAIIRFDEEELDNVYNEALALYPINIVTHSLLVPLLVELGERWESAEGSIAEEHFFSVYLRNKLGARFHHRVRNKHGPRLLGACMPGEQHEVGLLLFALTACDYGYQMVLLGANMPLVELPLAVSRSRSDGVVLSCMVEPAPIILSQELPTLVSHLTVPVFVGGKLSIRYRDAIMKAGAVALGEDLHQSMKRIDNAMKDTAITSRNLRERVG